MKNLKRVACLVLALALVCSLGLTALAASEDPYVGTTADTRGAEFPDVTDANNEEATYALKALGVFEGYPDGKFYPGNKMTRAEFAKIIFFFCGNKEVDATYFASLKSQFPDIAEGFWAEGYINFCATEGHFIGYPDGNFKPDNTVTMQEAATVLLRILGYTDDLRGVWPNDYNRKAVDIGLTEYVNYIGGVAATRDELAQMSYNILDCYKVTYIADATAASFGYILGAGSFLSPLTKSVQDSPNYGLFNMFGVDDEGYAYLYGRTNEGTYIYWDLLDAAFGASKWNVHFADLDSYDKELGVDMIESAGWHVANSSTGAIALDFIDESSVELASTYYLVGGDLTDLGDTEGRIILNAKGEAIFAATAGRAARTWTVDGKTLPLYTNNAGPANDYYDSYADADFGIFVSATADRLGYTTFSYVSSDEPDQVQSVVVKTALVEPSYRFYNVSTGKFISYTELVPGDVGYVAGLVGEATLILVYNASKGNLTEVTSQIGAAAGYAKIANTKYSYSDAVLSIDGGASYAPMTYEALRDAKVLTTMEVSFIPAYVSTGLAYVSANLTSSYTFPVGVLTGYTYGTDYVLLDGKYVAVRTYTGATLLTQAGKTETYAFAKAFSENSITNGMPGDLVTLQINKDGKVTNNTDTPWNFTSASPFVKYDPSTQIAITTNAANSRITIVGDDIYTLASDAVIFVVSSNAFGFSAVELVSAADFLKTASYKLNQVDIYSLAADNNTIKGLYVVNAVAADQTHVGVAVGASILNGKYILTMTDGTQYELADQVSDDELFEAAVPSFVTFKINAYGKIFNVARIMNQNMSDPDADYTEVNPEAFTEAFGSAYAMVTGTYKSIYTNSVVTDADLTLFLSGNTVYYNFMLNAPAAITDIASETEAAAHGTDATQVTYIYNTATQEIEYIFITNVAEEGK